MAKRLTDASIARMKPDPTKSYAVEVPDAGKPGLYLVIQPSGRKSFALRFRSQGKPRKLTLGFPSLATAHRLAQAALDAVAEGRDPASEKKETRRDAKAGVLDRDLFRRVVERYLEDYAAKRRNYREKARLLGMRHDNDEVIEGRAVALWGPKRIQDIVRPEIEAHLDALAKNAPIGANRTFSELRKFFNWAVSKSFLPASPMIGMAPPTDMQEEARRRRDRTLLRVANLPGSSDDELRWLWQACETYDAEEAGDRVHGKKRRGPFGPLAQLLILTGQRRSEVSQMKWNEIDRDNRIWTIPGSRTKNGKPHMVPLSTAALEIIDTLPHTVGKSGYLFTTNGRTPVSGYNRMKQRLDKLMAEAAKEERGEAVAIKEWRLHDLRRTVAAGMQRLGILLPVTEKVLNHTSGSFAGIVGVYQVYDYADEKTAALEAWGRFVTNLVSGENAAGNVVPLRA